MVKEPTWSKINSQCMCLNVSCSMHDMNQDLHVVNTVIESLLTANWPPQIHTTNALTALAALLPSQFLKLVGAQVDKLVGFTITTH